ncbi:HET-domain-containing protein, partial [Lepidopterella palustris CBS 459.81]
MASKSPIYDSLPVDSDSIRILTLLPGDKNQFSELQCELKCAKIDRASGSVTALEPPFEATPFEALSYTWGESVKTHTLLCNGLKIEITRNLFDALTELRHKSTERNMWIDAICINQEDANEKSKQIPLMKHIYQHATRVLIWLGPEGDSTEHALDLIRLASKCAQRELGFPPINEFDKWEPLVKLLHRQWFSRCWIKQESALASRATIHIG